MTYFSLLTRMQKKASCQKVFRMVSSAPDLKHKLRKLNVLGQRQTVRNNWNRLDYLPLTKNIDFS